jgi:GT2 family glycosyltransferase
VTSGTHAAVVIASFSEKRWSTLAAAIDSIYGQTINAAEIIVVADHCPRLAVRVASVYPGVRVVENTGPRGLSAARNCGVGESTASVIAFMDDDAVAEPTWLAELLAPYDDPSIIGAGGAIIPLWPESRTDRGNTHPTRRPAWFPEEFDWVVGCTYRGYPETPAPVRNLIGCNMSFRRDVFRHIGGFRADIGRIGDRPVGCEETEFCIRARQSAPQGTLLYVPSARVRHHVHPERTTWAYFRARCYAEGLSKAYVTELVGQGDGLASERAYTARTLPRGVLRNFMAGVRDGEPGRIGQAGAIVAGLACTTAGYAVGKAGLRLRHQGPRAGIGTSEMMAASASGTVE